MTRARNVLAVILTPKAEESSEVLYCDTKNNWTLRCAQNDENAIQEMTGFFAALRMTEMHNEEARLLQFVEKVVPMRVY